MILAHQMSSSPRATAHSPARSLKCLAANGLVLMAALSGMVRASLEKVQPSGLLAQDAATRVSFQLESERMREYSLMVCRFYRYCALILMGCAYHIMHIVGKTL